MRKRIPLIYAGDFPPDVEDWCIRHDISTHYDDDVAYIENDGNPFFEWLVSEGEVNPSEKGIWVAVQGT